jgi:hypothetical protein
MFITNFGMILNPSALNAILSKAQVAGVKPQIVAK